MHNHKDEDRLNLPVTKENLPPSRVLSMDQYLEFVYFNLRYTVDINSCRRLKKGLHVDRSFKL